MSFGKISKHESYGLIGCSRITSSKGQSLFGSSIKHSNTIMLRIKTASVDRHLNRDWYHGEESLIEVELSQTQFAEMITSLNMGDGVPCTLRYTGKNIRIEDPPEVKQRELFEEEFRNNVESIEELYRSSFKETSELLNKKGTLKVDEKKKIKNFLFSLTRIINDKIPFIQKQFNKAMDKTVLEAKGEVEAFVMNKVTSLGIEGLEKEMLKLNEGEK